MADTNEYFASILPNKIQDNLDSFKAVGSVFQFNVDGAGIWHVDLNGNCEVVSGEHDAPDCTVTTNKDTFDSIIDDPSSAMGAFMSGQLAADNLSLAMQLQQFLG